ncbi:hypothetical protein [Streptomyces sp. ALB3]|uniref:hypothetical protein n=1 Tax=Streptomyces sp. ALB3 TaxID=3374278 RepID=UPI0037B510F0
MFFGTVQLPDMLFVRDVVTSKPTAADTGPAVTSNEELLVLLTVSRFVRVRAMGPRPRTIAVQSLPV